MNRFIKILGISLLVFFLSLYFSKYNSDYYESKKILTDNKIKEYEKDLKDGKIINSSNYVIEEKNYNNTASKIGIKVSKLIENSFQSGLKFIINKLESLDNS